MVSKPSSYFRVFQLIDMFGLKTEFQIDHKSKFKTISGGLFTLVYAACIIILFFSFGSDMLMRTNPETSISQIYQPSPSPTTVSKNSYMFVFGLQDSTGSHFIDEEIYTAKLTYGYRNQTTKQDEVQIIPLQRCEEANMPNNRQLGDYFKNQVVALNNLYCISKNYTEPLILQGAWDQERYEFFRLYIAPCNSSQNTCKSQAEIYDKLKTSFYAYYSTDYLFDMRNYQSPANVFGRDYFIETTTNIKKMINRYLKTNHLYDDNGWIADSMTENQYYSFDNDRESFQILTESDSIVDMVIRKSTYETILTRRYQKIQNVFAEMTGFLKIIFAILYIISRPFIKKEYYDTLTNNIYNFEMIPDGKIKKQKKIKKKKREQSLEKMEKLKTLKSLMMETENNHESPPDMGSDKMSQIHIKKKKKNDEELVNCLFKLKESPLNLTYFEMMKGFFVTEPSFQLKKAQRKVGVSSIFSQLDIKFILKKFAEIDKLKMILLNEDQYHLFEYLPKPVIMKNAKINLNQIDKHESPRSPTKVSSFAERKSNFFIHENDFILKAKTVQKAFANIVKKTEMNEIDKKLIESLDADIFKVLEANFDTEDNAKTTNLGLLFKSPKENKVIEIESLVDLEKASDLSEKKQKIVIDRNGELVNDFKPTCI